MTSVKDALAARKSTRAFLDKPVPRDVIERILLSAGHAPSGTNTQPWQVAVVSGSEKQALEAKLLAAAEAGEEEKMDYLYYPVEWVEPFKSRRRACGLQLYSTLQISREDKQRQREQWMANYRAFDAPVALYFFLDPIMKTGSFMDYGMFLQSVMLCAVEEGLATCAQAALGQFPAIVKDHLGYDRDQVLVCGMALGYEDTEAVINSYRTPRLPITEFVRFFGD